MIYLRNTQNILPICYWRGLDIGSLFWLKDVMYAQPLSLQYYVEYSVQLIRISYIRNYRIPVTHTVLIRSIMSFYEISSTNTWHRSGSLWGIRLVMSSVNFAMSLFFFLQSPMQNTKCTKAVHTSSPTYSALPIKWDVETWMPQGRNPPSMALGSCTRTAGQSD